MASGGGGGIGQGAVLRAVGALAALAVAIALLAAGWFGLRALSANPRDEFSLERTGAEMPAGGAGSVQGPINTDFEGITTFRGNATRTYYGEGPVPDVPVVRWAQPDQKMCSNSYVGIEKRRWCGTGWTGQPNVIVLPDDTIEVREGAYDGRYHFLDGLSGKQLRPPLVTGDLAKGSASSDPDGYPLYYGGSRDNYLRVVAMDRPRPTVLWALDADISVPRPLRNNDWDGAPLVVDDVLFEGGENGWLYAIRLHRSYGPDGLVRVAPEVVATVPGFDPELLEALGDREVSIENSVALYGDVLYFANSGGLVQGWDVSDILAGGTELSRVFRFWTGDDVDASIAIDDAGALYVAGEYQRASARSRAVGQLMKLDPSRPDHPLVWSIPATEVGFEGAGGSWSTPALTGPVVVFTTAAGRVLGVDRATGDVLWEERVAAPSIGSPVVVDGVLIQGDCSGDLYAWDVHEPTEEPSLLWKAHLPGCIESTPAVWHGWIYLGTRDGRLYGLADAPATDSG